MTRKCGITRNKDSNWVEVVSASGKVSLARSNEIIWNRKSEELARREEISDERRVERRKVKKK